MLVPFFDLIIISGRPCTLRPLSGSCPHSALGTLACHECSVDAPCSGESQLGFPRRLTESMSVYGAPWIWRICRSMEYRRVKVRSHSSHVHLGSGLTTISPAGPVFFLISPGIIFAVAAAVNLRTAHRDCCTPSPTFGLKQSQRQNERLTRLRGVAQFGGAPRSGHRGKH